MYLLLDCALLQGANAAGFVDKRFAVIRLSPCASEVAVMPLHRPTGPPTCFAHLQVTCKEPYEWKDATEEEWEFAKAGERPGRCSLVMHCYLVEPCMACTAWHAHATTCGEQVSLLHRQAVAHSATAAHSSPVITCPAASHSAPARSQERQRRRSVQGGCL